ncbi:pilus assembly protein TadG-related protein [Streptomyces sp. NPDC048352]|uniref:pilus assembly protein TadG-related protein n=1 Tax=Streptomyces sp. NPDC048352 TaxID=3154718 RepID=UPI00342F8D07
MAERGRGSQDRGQAFPIYIVAIAGLLFAALAFFVIGQASVTRSDAQGAADAAALAAAQDARDHLLPGLVLAELQPKDWEAILKGGRFDSTGACGKAADFAENNGATASCAASGLNFKVSVRTKRTVGSSVIPGTDDMNGTADANAVIEPRCHLESVVPPTPAPTPIPTPSAGEKPPPSDDSPPKAAAVKIQCKGGKGITFDPAEPSRWRALGRLLFDVRLSD